MARSPHSLRLLVRLLPLLLLFGGALQAAPVTIYPAPEGADLSSDYEVWIDGTKVDIYRAETIRKGPYGHSYDFGGDYSFTYFTLPERIDAPVQVRIKSHTQHVRDLVIRPVSHGIKPEFGADHTATLAITKPGQYVIEPDGKRHPLLIFANPAPVETITKSSPEVIYFGPGLHKPEKIELKDNQTLYIAGGAVVKAGVLVKGDRATICGPGILDGSDWPWAKGPVGHGFINAFGNYLTIRDIVILGSPNWTIKLNNIHHVRIQNVKLCNARVQNDDGVDICNSQRVLIENCFMRCDDDCIAIKGMHYSNPKNPDNGVSKVVVRNCILWADRARVALLGHESHARHMKEITFDNIDIIHFAMTPMLLEPGEDMTLSEVKFRNMRIHGEGQGEIIRVRPMVNQYMAKQVPGFARDISFENISVHGQPGGYKLRFLGADPQHTTVKIRVRRTLANGNRIDRNDSPYVKTNEHTRDIDVAW